MEEILKRFHGVLDEPDETLKMTKLNEQFCSIAREVLYGGYFLVEETKKIFLDDIEFYYHEETENGLKDPVMYHTNDHEGKELPYYEIGRLNLHVSGVDVTFENPVGYRASFLIRGFHVEDLKGAVIKDYSSCSTHIYDEMLYLGVPLKKSIEIEWVSEKKLTEYNDFKPNGEWRQNVAEYEKDENGKYIKVKKGSKEEYVKKLVKGGFSNELHFHYNKKDYVRCGRKWRFKKPNLK